MPQARPSEHAFRAAAHALDALPEGEETIFLARLVLILAEELADPQKFDACIGRASVPSHAVASIAKGST